MQAIYQFFEVIFAIFLVVSCIAAVVFVVVSIARPALIRELFRGSTKRVEEEWLEPDDVERLPHTDEGASKKWRCPQCQRKVPWDATIGMYRCSRCRTNFR